MIFSFNSNIFESSAKALAVSAYFGMFCTMFNLVALIRSKILLCLFGGERTRLLNYREIPIILFRLTNHQIGEFFSKGGPSGSTKEVEFGRGLVVRFLDGILAKYDRTILS